MFCIWLILQSGSKLFVKESKIHLRKYPEKVDIQSDWKIEKEEDKKEELQMIHNIIIVSYLHQIFTKEAAKTSVNGLQFHHFLPFSVIQKEAGGPGKEAFGQVIFKWGHQLVELSAAGLFKGCPCPNLLARSPLGSNEYSGSHFGSQLFKWVCCISKNKLHCVRVPPSPFIPAVPTQQHFLQSSVTSHGSKFFFIFRALFSSRPFERSPQ